MAWQVTALTGLLVTSGLLALVVAALAWQERHRSGAAVMAAVLVVVSLWGIGQAILVAGPSLGTKLFGFNLSLVGFLSIPPLWLRYTLTYTGYDERFPRPLLGVFTLAPLGLVALVFTNDVHGLLYVAPTLDGTGVDAVLTYEWTPFYWGVISLAYGQIAVATWLFAEKFLRSRNVYRRRTFFFFVLSVTLTGCHLISQLGLSPVPSFTLGPLYFLLADVLSILAFVSYRSLSFIPINRVLGLFGTRSVSLSPLARETVIEEIHNGMIVLDHNNRIVDVNHRAKRMLGGDDGRVVGRRLREVVPPDLFVTDDTRFLDPDAPEGQYKGIWLSLPDGEQRCFDVTLTGIETDDGSTAGRVGLIHDVTERERRKQKLESRTEELERQNDQLENVASVVSHDLRSPLNVASGAVDLAESDGDPQYFEKVRTAHHRMEAIIDDVLTMARQGQTVDETEPVDLERVVRDSWEHVETADATLTVAFDHPVRIVADRGRLSQVFENFFRNSVEHGGPTVAVTVGTISPAQSDGPAPDSGPVGFYVEDDGPGIPEGKREDVLKEGVSTSANGTGFGLAIISTIVEAHGWDITVTDGTAGGARFEITGLGTARDSEAPPQRLS